MSHDMRARIGSARLLLGPLVGQPTHAPASRTQCIALLDAIQKSSLTIGERASLSALALGVSWCGGDAKSIADAFVPPAKLQRQSMQNFEALPEYFVDSEWVLLLDSSKSMTAKSDVIISRAVALGCRCPTEPTMKSFTSLLLVVCEPADQLLTMSFAQKGDIMKHMRVGFKRWARRATKPVAYIDHLPSVPMHLKQNHLSLFEAAYAGGLDLVPCRIDMKVVCSVDVSFQCRGGASHTPNLQLSGIGGPQMGQLERFASGMMDGMCRMQATQQTMFEFMMRSQTSGSHSNLGSLPALSQLSAPASHPALSAMGPLAITCGSSESSLERVTPIAEVVGLPESGSERSVEERGADGLKQSQAGVMNLLDMLEQRETSKRPKKAKAFRNHECDNLMCWINLGALSHRRSLIYCVFGLRSTNFVGNTIAISHS
jgi:hypothetical protein